MRPAGCYRCGDKRARVDRLGLGHGTQSQPLLIADPSVPSHATFRSSQIIKRERDRMVTFGHGDGTFLQTVPLNVVVAMATELQYFQCYQWHQDHRFAHSLYLFVQVTERTVATAPLNL